MSKSDATYSTALNAVGFRPKVVSNVVPNITIDVEDAVGVAAVVYVLQQTASYVTTSGSGGANPFIHVVVGSSANSTVTVSGTWANDTALAAALNDTANFVNTAGTRTVGEPFEDVETAFEKIDRKSVV